MPLDSVPPAVPVHVERGFDFEDWSANHPGEPLPATNIDAEYDRTNDTVNLVMDRLALIQRDDGQLANNSVGIDQVDPSVFGAITVPIEEAVEEAQAAAAAAEAAAIAASESAQQAADAASLIPTPVIPDDVGKVPVVNASGDYGLQTIGGGGTLVSSVFGRLGDILALAGDYTAAKISYAGAVANVQLALDQLYTNKLDRTLGAVASNVAVAAAGVNQAAATQLAADMNAVTTAVAGVNDGVKLPASTPGTRVVVTNDTAVPVKVYPQTGDTVDGKAVNVAYVLAPGQTSEFFCTTNTNWDSNLGAMLSDNLPVVRGSPSAGFDTQASRSDHVHPPVALNDNAQVANRLPVANIVQAPASTMLGNNTGATADIKFLTVAQIQALLSFYTTAQVDALIANCAKLNAINVFTKAQRQTPFGLNASGVTVPDFAESNYFKATLNANYAIPNPVNTIEGQSGLFILLQDATGGRVVTWGAQYKFPGGIAPVNTLTTGAKDVVPYYVNAVGEVLCGSLTADIK